MIAFVPSPSAVASKISARHTALLALLRSGSLTDLRPPGNHLSMDGTLGLSRENWGKSPWWIVRFLRNDNWDRRAKKWAALLNGPVKPILLNTYFRDRGIS